MKRLAAVLAAATLTVTLGSGAAHAATTTTATTAPAMVAAAATSKPPVTIAKISTKKVAKGKTVTVKPTVRTSGSNVKVTSKLITATKKGVNLRNKTSVKLKAGTYKVTQTVKYQVQTTKRVTFDQYDVVFPDCKILEVISEDSLDARLRIVCNDREFPGSQKFTVDLEWMYCGWDEYLDYKCSASEYLDGATWWEGQTTDGTWTISTDSDDYVTPRVGEKFWAIMQVQRAEPVTLSGKVWSQTKAVKTTQTLKVVTKK